MGVSKSPRKVQYSAIEGAVLVIRSSGCGAVVQGSVLCSKTSGLVTETSMMLGDS